MKKTQVTTVAVLIIAAIIALTNYLPKKPNKPSVVDGDFTAHFIDVGQADAAIITCGGEAMMIDGGNVDDSRKIVSYLKSQNIDHLKYIFCTHPHEDHVGGLSGALNQCSVDEVLCSEQAYNSKAFEDFKKYTKKQEKEIEIPKVNDEYYLGGSVIDVIGPIDKSEDTNNNSIVLKIIYGENTFLFSADAERDEENDILDTGADLKADVLKVGHHGSSTSTTYRYLREVMPEYAIISVGKDNSYGHPHEETLSRLSDAGAKVFRTDESGNIIVVSDGKNITVTTEK